MADATTDDRPTIRVRIACVVVVDELGTVSYNACGWKDERGRSAADDHHEAFSNAVDILPTGQERRVWVECDVPLPDPAATIEGDVANAD